jgi:hypothetical protein
MAAFFLIFAIIVLLIILIALIVAFFIIRAQANDCINNPSAFCASAVCRNGISPSPNPPV